MRDASKHFARFFRALSNLQEKHLLGKSLLRFLLPPPLTNYPANFARFCKLLSCKSVAKSCTPFVALLCISSLLSFANAYKFISSAGVAGGGKLTANGVDIGWLNFTKGVPLSVSFGGQIGYDLSVWIQTIP